MFKSLEGNHLSHSSCNAVTLCSAYWRLIADLNRPNVFIASYYFRNTSAMFSPDPGFRVLQQSNQPFIAVCACTDAFTMHNVQLHFVQYVSQLTRTVRNLQTFVGHACIIIQNGRSTLDHQSYEIPIALRSLCLIQCVLSHPHSPWFLSFSLFFPLCWLTVLVYINWRADYTSS